MTATTQGPLQQNILNRLEFIADLMDSKFSIFGFSFGFDAIIGLLPGLGDILGGIISVYILFEARKLPLSPAIQSALMRNVLIDVFVGAIPIGGDIFDAFFKVNKRNVRLIREQILTSAA